MLSNLPGKVLEFQLIPKGLDNTKLTTFGIQADLTLDC